LRYKSFMVGIIALALLMLLIVWTIALKGLLPFSYVHARSPRDLLLFLDSRRQDVRGVSANRHILEIGKRPSLQVIKGYDKVMYLMRPFHQINFKFRNFTKAEILDFCTNITGDDLDNLRSDVAARKDVSPVWKGSIEGKELAIIRVTQFSYIVTGLADKPLFMAQIELAKRLGMDDATVLKLLIPAQDRWLEKFMADSSFKKHYPVQFQGSTPDELIDWLGGPQE